MKNPIKILPFLLVILAITGFYACEKSPETGLGSAEFALSLPGGQLKSGTIGDSVTTTYQVMVTIQNLQGNPVLTDKLIPIYSFGTGFVSEKIEIKAGEFKLMKFMVINASGEVLYASPVAGSQLAYLTTKPLPFTFNIYPDKVTQIMPEVLVVGSNTPDKFGYANFSVNIIKPLTFWTAAVIDNPSTLTATPLFTDASLTVYAKDGWRYTYKLFAGINQLIIRGGSDTYSFILEKTGYISQKLQFTSTQLLATTKEAPLYLKIPKDTSALKTLILQPGPDGGIDAMISNLEPEKNFGGHKYFEATFLSEPVLTVMRLNRSLIRFDLKQVPTTAIIKKVVLRLFYEVPLPWDSTQIKPASSTSFVGGVLQQVTESWEENAVTWNKQPASSELNQVLILPFIRNVNFIELDVMKLLFPPSANNLPNYGMKFKLVPEDKWPGFRFASSDHSNIALRPKLTIYYTN